MNRLAALFACVALTLAPTLASAQATGGLPGPSGPAGAAGAAGATGPTGAAGNVTITGSTTAGDCMLAAATSSTPTAIIDSGACPGGASAVVIYQTPFGSALNPTAPASTSAFAMQGMGSTFTITPLSSHVNATVAGIIENGANTTGGQGIRYILYWGTGTAPSNGASVTGTQCTPQINITAPSAVAGTNAYQSSFSATCNLSGVSAGIPIWFDLSSEAANGTGYSFRSVVASLMGL